MPDGATYAEKLSAQWQSRLRAMDGLVDYADALRSIVAASEQGASSVGALADSVSQLAAAAGIVFPAAGTAAVATDTAKLAYAQIALMRSARALEKALGQSQPAVEQIARTIARDLGDLSAIFQAANASILLALQSEHNRGLGFRQGLVDERNILYAKGLGAFTAQERARLKEITEFITSTNEWHGPYSKRRDDIERRLSAGQTLMQAAAETVVRWGLAYNNMVLAVQERRPVSTQSLTQAAVDLGELVRRIQAL
jgi:Glucosamine 6-phosphate synthetase, contains amidotransferase and phosphosugar isomerase domains